MVKAEDLSIINQLRALRDEDLSNESFFKELKTELLGDSIYVFTPMGDVKELPKGANAIDFAYMIHSSIGEKIIGAKADGKIIPLTQPLKNTQIIEVLTSPYSHPTQAHLKAVKTSRAHSRINASSASVPVRPPIGSVCRGISWAFASSCSRRVKARSRIGASPSMGPPPRGAVCSARQPKPSPKLTSTAMA